MTEKQHIQDIYPDIYTYKLLTRKRNQKKKKKRKHPQMISALPTVS